MRSRVRVVDVDSGSGEPRREVRTLVRVRGHGLTGVWAYGARVAGGERELPRAGTQYAASAAPVRGLPVPPAEDTASEAHWPQPPPRPLPHTFPRCCSPPHRVYPTVRFPARPDLDQHRRPSMCYTH